MDLVYQGACWRNLEGKITLMSCYILALFIIQADYSQTSSFSHGTREELRIVVLLLGIMIMTSV